ncbi:MAG: PspA/IM30 family protein, partial [Chloroflexota bacterium]|nr:PspA/IM30 family protein [Chloroflexota bacterium]
MIDQILRDMQSSITSARAQVAAMIAQEKELEAEVSESEELVREWEAKARRAVEAGKDDLAREALRRKHDAQENLQLYREQHTTQEHTVEKLKSQLQKLESKYQATLSQRDSLIARQRRARAQQQVAERIGTSFSPLDASSELERMERKIRSNEARAAATAEIEDTSFDTQFRELDYDVEIERELEALKSGSSPSAPALGDGQDTNT